MRNSTRMLIRVKRVSKTNKRYSHTDSVHSEVVSPSIQSQTALTEAFSWFKEASDHLSRSYSQLEHQVKDLSGELADLSEQRMLELSEKEQLADQLEHLLHLLPAGVVVLDSHGIVVRVNQVAGQMLVHSTTVNFPKHSLLAKPILAEPINNEPLTERQLIEQQLVGKQWRDLVRDNFLEDGADGHEVTSMDGRKIGIALSALEKEPGQIILLTDLTETRRLQAKVSQSERLSALGRVAASLAHQIRTPLSAALLYSENITRRELNKIQYQQFAEKITQRLRNIEQQIRDMMLFARGEIQLNLKIDLAMLVEKICLHSEVVLQQSGFHLDVNLPDSLRDMRILCHESALLGAIQNLINNAIEVTLLELQGKTNTHPTDTQNDGSISNGSTHSVELRLSCEQFDYVKLEIIDRGPGIDVEALSRLMEPFYSTKPKGTGLGLAVVGAVVRAHKGQFTLKNCAHRKGAIAEIILPLELQR